jgi:hypothetical protein
VPTALLVVAATVLATGLVGPGQTSAEAANPRVSGIELKFGESERNSLAVKTATAVCPAGKRVLGGGGSIGSSSGYGADAVTLTRLKPYMDGTTGRFGYAARAAETYSGTTGDWSVNAWAICANPVPGLHIVVEETASSSLAKQATAALCPSGKRALGSGAEILFDLSQFQQGVGLQVARASGTGDIARAQAHEAPSGYPHNWRVAAYAICATTPPGYEVRYGGSDTEGSEDVKVATVDCPEYWDYSIPGVPRKFRKQTVGMGGAVTDSAPGNATLSGIHPWFYDLVRLRAVENTPTSLSWDGIAVQAICVY